MTESLAIVPRTIEECTDLAKRLAESTLIPAAMRNKMPDVLVTILAGQEMGLAPMASLRAFHVIEGKPVLSADGMVAIILGSGKAEYFERVEESEQSVTYETKRRGSLKPRRCTWTLAQAKAAALTSKDNWRLYPRAMLASRAKAELARDVYPDVLAGCFLPDEMERSEPVERVEAIEDAEVVDALGQIEACQTEEALKALAPALSELPPAQKAEAKCRYAARLAAVRKAAVIETAEPTA